MLTIAKKYDKTDVCLHETIAFSFPTPAEAVLTRMTTGLLMCPLVTTLPIVVIRLGSTTCTEIGLPKTANENTFYNTDT